MSAEALAQFALSLSGDLYLRICELRGVDPGAPLMAEDDVLAHDFATALYLARPKPEVPEGKEGDDRAVVTDLEQQIEAMLNA